MQKKIKTDVVIIGAGYAGIAAARTLQEKGIDFIVLEARDRIGGRTYSTQLGDGISVDLGAQWVGPTQNNILAWIKETNTQTFNTFDEGYNILHYQNKLSKYKGTIPKIDPISLLSLGWAINKINKLSASIDLSKPWKHVKAKQYDSMTLQTWMDKNIHTQKAKYLFKVGVETVFATAPAELSFLHTLFYCKSGNSMDALISIKDGAQQTFLIGGTQTLLKKIAQAFETKIYINEVVRKIEQHTENAIVYSSNYQIETKKIISTIPPTLLNSIQFSPILPQLKAQLLQRIPMGAAMKCFCIYNTPFWRDKGYSGQIVSDIFPIKVTFDCTNQSNEKGILLVFVEGNDARYFITLPQEHRKKMVIDGLTKIFGEEAKSYLAYEDKCWTEEEFSRGCYAGNYPPGVLTSFENTLRVPFNHVHFAGTETAERWNGYMEGAIESGKRASQEVIAIL
jgi:monoamine oxidase